MMIRIAAILFCTTAPAALFAQAVELRSSDEFISVEGEIIGFNGVMLRVQTSVGPVSVPASEVICYGAGCQAVIDNNSFGLTASAFQDVVGDLFAVEVIGLTDDLEIGFAAPIFGTLYRTIVGAFAVASQTTSNVELSSAGQILLQGASNNQTATLTPSQGGAEVDITVQTVSLGGTLDQAYIGPSGWMANNQLTHQMIGLKAFSVIVAPNAGITDISMNDLARIYAGEVTNWSQIGGADVSILPLQLPTNSPVRDEIIRLVMEPAGKAIAGNVLTMADEAGIMASINQFPGSISIVSAADAAEDLVVDVAGSCGIAVAPTNFNIISGDYPLVRPVMATYAEPPKTQLLAELFDFASEDVAQGLLQREGFTSYDAALQDTAAKNGRLTGLLSANLDEAQRAAAAEMFQILFDAERFSTTMTGGAASGPEGAWNRAMMIDLAAALDSGEYSGREVAFVGFGESTAGSEAAINASATAAADIQAAFERFASDVISSRGYAVSSHGFGNVSPVTCYDGQVAGSEYTRVEVWIR